MLVKFKNELPPKEVAILLEVVVHKVPEIYPLNVIEERMLLVHGMNVDQVLVHWMRLNDHDTFWEEGNIAKLFLSSP